MITILKKTVIKENIKIIGASGSGFNPLLFDVANLLALYDGDVGVQVVPFNNVTGWLDQSVNGYDLTAFNTPQRIPNAINGHNAIQFDGINQYGRANGINTIQPVTYYLVFKQITSTADDGLFDGVIARQAIYQKGLIDLTSYAGIVTGTTFNPAIAINAYQIITTVFNSPNSEQRTNNNISVVLNSGVSGINNFVLSTNQLLTRFGNFEFAYLIIRGAADNTATQNLFINWLKTRFAL